MHKNSLSNLKNLRDRSPEERREIASAGGKARQEQLQKAKTLKEELTALLATGDTKRNIVAALVDSALRGNVAAIKEVGVLLGERSEKTEVNGGFLGYENLSWHEKELVADLLVNSGVTGLLSLDDSQALVDDLLE